MLLKAHLFAAIHQVAEIVGLNQPLLVVRHCDEPLSTTLKVVTAQCGTNIILLDE